MKKINKKALSNDEAEVINQFAEEMSLRTTQVKQIHDVCTVYELTSQAKEVSHSMYLTDNQHFESYRERSKDEVKFYSDIEIMQTRFDDIDDLEQILKTQDEDLPLDLKQEKDKLEDELAEISVNFAEQFKESRNLINKYSESEEAYLILSGELKSYVAKNEIEITKKNTEKLVHKEFTLNIQGAGELVGEISLILNTFRTAHVMPNVTPTRVLKIPKSVFNHWREENPEFNNSLLKMMAKRVIYMTQNTESLALEQMYTRLKRLILQKIGKVDPSTQQTYITKEYSHAAIAQHVGTTRPNITMLMSKLVKSGYMKIDEEGRKVFLKDLPDQI